MVCLNKQQIVECIVRLMIFIILDPRLHSPTFHGHWCARISDYVEFRKPLETYMEMLPSNNKIDTLFVHSWPYKSKDDGTMHSPTLETMVKSLSYKPCTVSFVPDIFQNFRDDYETFIQFLTARGYVPAVWTNVSTFYYY